MSDDRGVTSVDVLIVGAGFAGIGMGIQLARRGRESFVIIEIGRASCRERVFLSV